MIYAMIQCMSAFVATVTLAVIMKIPKKYIVYSGIIGTVGWMLYLGCSEINLDVIVANFSGALIVALCSHSCARIFKSPVTVFLIPGLLPLVPGLGMYRIAYNIVRGENELAVFYFLQTFQIAGVIAMAILIMDTIFRAFQKNR